MSRRRLLVFAKPARPGRVKTRLIGALTAEQAAELHEALLRDLLGRLAGGEFSLRLAWALEAGESPPPWSPPWVRQQGADLGARLHGALAGAAAEGCAAVAAVGSDHPDLGRADVEGAFARVEAGAGVALAPAGDGGYALIALAAAAVQPELFARIPWSTPRVLDETLARCRQVGLEVALLPEQRDLDTPEDLRRLAAALAGECSAVRSPRAEALLERWRRPRRILGQDKGLFEVPEDFDAPLSDDLLADFEG